jgi:hypothetical protein
LINGKRRNEVFQDAMIRFLDNPETSLNPGNSTLSELIYGWGNEAWSAREEFLACCISHTMSNNGAILECGSGLSTLLIATVAKRHNQMHWVLEHKPDWAKRVQSYLDAYGLHAHITACALKDFGKFCWYDVPQNELPQRFSLIVCDGPPNRTTKGGRYGLVPIMKEHIVPNCIILLDDAYRKEEREIAERWCNELGGAYQIQGIAKPYIVITVPPR